MKNNEVAPPCLPAWRSSLAAANPVSTQPLRGGFARVDTGAQSLPLFMQASAGVHGGEFIQWRKENAN